ncbi:D-2-hydroxyacid dehydrogenase [Helicobacter sp. 11S02629-2]|uniref:D-2-hydroxyacid dehydrogenase n=1 Tax=Helicobacter sp. 11S02629-2 TaxID=1476195 RepID=UPI000BA61820|nr:D-2-hydroxyacid dehydrogenase [Helicobacter sp. 11S02629-2]PAF45370.1 hydroxyacid dehydrogenase [Helicobacter sp. 11S02629-2]
MKKLVMLDALTLGQFDKSLFNIEGFESVFYDITKNEDVLSRCKDATIVITNKVELRKDTLKQLPNLKLICVSATGTNNVDLDVCKELGIAVKNVAGYSTKSVAQHTFMLALGLLGQLSYYSHYVSSKQWEESEIFCNLDFPLQDINNKEWGIIGLGSIGHEVAKIATTFGAKVSHYSTSGKNTHASYPNKSLKDLLSTSDIISIHAPLNETTKNLISKNELALLKENAVLLNLGRGGIVNEKDLASEIKKRNIFFGADVLEKEPMEKNHVFNELFNSKDKNKLLLTPHVAWAYEDSKNTLIASVVANIKDYLGGK